MKVVLLQGLGSGRWSFYGLKRFLEARNVEVTIVDYPVDSEPFQKCVEVVEESLKGEKGSFVVIGQSMGGVIGASLKNPNIEMLITIGSPLKGASMLKDILPGFIRTIEDLLPSSLNPNLNARIQSTLNKPNHDHLRELLGKDVQPPPFKYHCITMSYIYPYNDFDGCVYNKEARFDNFNTTNIPLSGHCVVFFDPRLWFTIEKILCLEPKW